MIEPHEPTVDGENDVLAPVTQGQKLVAVGTNPPDQGEGVGQLALLESRCLVIRFRQDAGANLEQGADDRPAEIGDIVRRGGGA